MSVYVWGAKAVYGDDTDSQPVKSAFISFDFDHDEELRDHLVAQSENPDSPFRIADMSVHESFDERWKKTVRQRIRKADLVIFICGEHTHDARGVTAEMSFTREEKRPYFLLRGRPKKTCNKPRGATKTDEMHKWTWSNLKNLIAGA